MRQSSSCCNRWVSALTMTILSSYISAFDYSGEYDYSITCNGAELPDMKTRDTDGVYTGDAYFKYLSGSPLYPCGFSYTGDPYYFSDGVGPIMQGRKYYPQPGTPIPARLIVRPKGCYISESARCIFKVWRHGDKNNLFSMVHCRLTQQIDCPYTCDNGQVRGGYITSCIKHPTNLHPYSFPASTLPRTVIMGCKRMKFGAPGALLEHSTHARI
jgi:hypothetical protein